MTKNLAWTDKHWSVVQTLLEQNVEPLPWYAAVWRLRESSPNITPDIAAEVIKSKIVSGQVEVVKRGNSRRRKGMLYIRLADHTPRQVTSDDLYELRTGR